MSFCCVSEPGNLQRPCARLCRCSGTRGPRPGVQPGPPPGAGVALACVSTAALCLPPQSQSPAPPTPHRDPLRESAAKGKPPGRAPVPAGGHLRGPSRRPARSSIPRKTGPLSREEPGRTLAAGASLGSQLFPAPTCLAGETEASRGRGGRGRAGPLSPPPSVRCPVGGHGGGGSLASQTAAARTGLLPGGSAGLAEWPPRVGWWAGQQRVEGGLDWAPCSESSHGTGGDSCVWRGAQPVWEEKATPRHRGAGGGTGSPGSG